MTYKEYEDKIRAIIANPDTLATEGLAVLDEIKKDTETITALQDDAQKSDQKIRQLQDSNTALTLRVLGTPGKETEEVAEDWRNLRGKEAIDAFMKSKEDNNGK